MKFKLIHGFIIVEVLLITMFFLSVIPMRVETQAGDLDTSHFVYGGLFWTSISQMISWHNYKPLWLWVAPFILNTFCIVAIKNGIME